MIDHFGINCSDLAASAATFYDRVLGVLGHRRLMDFEVAIGYGTESPDFWIAAWEDDDAQPRGARRVHRPGRGDRAGVPRRGARARRRGAARPAGCGRSTTPGYFGAFVRDPDGNNVEAVCHTAPEG